MAQSFHFEMFKAPQNPTEANNLASHLSMQVGHDGWTLVSVVPIGDGSVLLFCFQQSE